MGHNKLTPFTATRYGLSLGLKPMCYLHFIESSSLFYDSFLAFSLYLDRTASMLQRTSDPRLKPMAAAEDSVLWGTFY